jgi:phosphate-selective porin OprO/OprP
LAYGPFKLQGEYFDFNYDRATGSDLGAKGMYVQAMWNLTGEKHNYSNSSGTFGWIKPNSQFSTEKGGSGAWQAGLRYSKIDGSDGLGDTNKNKADAMTFGLNWIANTNVRVMLNYVVTDFAVPLSGISKEKALNLRGQVSF